MKDIFAGFYNKIVGFFTTTEEQHDESKNVARNRLKLVLMQDRTNLNPYLLERMRGELIDLLSKYVEMDREALDLNFENDGDSVALMLSIPVIRAKEEQEIEDALKAEDEAKREIEEKLKTLEEKEAAENEVAEDETTEAETAESEVDSESDEKEENSETDDEKTEEEEISVEEVESTEEKQEVETEEVKEEVEEVEEPKKETSKSTKKSKESKPQDSKNPFKTEETK